MEIRPTYLIMVTADNNNKYYNCFPEGDSFRVEYGRVDVTKSVCNYPISKWNSTINSKIRKGYKDVTDLKKALVEEKIVSDVHNSPYDEIENIAIREIVNKLQSLAKETIKKNYSVSSSKVTQDMVDNAQSIIDDISSSNFSSPDSFNKMLIELFSVIPRKMDNVKNYLANSTDDFAKILDREQSLLDVMRGQVVVKSSEETINDSPKVGKTILEDLGINFEEVDDADVSLIKNLMAESSSKFRKAWRVSNYATQNNFDKFVKDNDIKDTRLLFHGSRSENFWSIIKTGLKLRPTNAVITGKMFGYGIYYAPKCQKSIGYTSLSGSYWAHGGNNRAYMAIFEVAYGKPYDVYDFSSKYYDLTYDKLQNFKKGANCLHAHADKGMLRNDEIVVYKEDQMTIKYLIEIGNDKV